MFYDGDKAYSPLVCIGKNVPVSPTDTICSLCVSPAGRIAIVEQDPYSRGESGADFVSRVMSHIDVLRKWDCDKLDEIAADYFYETTGQAARGIDIMAMRGYLTWSGKHDFFAGVNAGFQKDAILVIIPVKSDELAMRKVEFSQGSIGRSDLLISLVEKTADSQF